jgi:glycosyltransferase involved in cell wall biosynthesis
MRMHVGVFATHPIQYQVPLWRGLERDADIDLDVFYFSDQGVSGAIDPGFGQALVWDIPLLEGYSSRFLSRRPVGEANSFSIRHPKQILQEYRFDVIVLHGYTHRFARQLVRLKNKYGYKIVLRGEFTEMPRRTKGLRSIAKRLYLKWFYRHVDHFCPIGKDAIDHLQRYGIAKDKMTLAPYSVDDGIIRESLQRFDRVSSRKLLHIRDDHIVFLFSGKMIARKQPLLLADALLALGGSYSNFTAIFLGSGEQFQPLCKKVKAQLGHRFIAPGFVNQSELGLYFTAADVFVLPSTYDTWGLVVNEAMHYGLPCIVSDKVGAGRDLVESGLTGDVFKFDSLSDLKNCLERVRNNPDSVATMGKNALKRIEGYTIEATLRGLKTAIQKAHIS